MATLAVTGVVRAEVVDVQPSGFTLEIRLHIAAPPQKVYEALIHPAAWWNGAHSFSGDAKNLSIEAKAGGCFCETTPNGGSVQHAVVVYAQPGEALTLRGAMGPFQGQGVDGAITFTLKAAGNGTDLTFENTLGGYIKGGVGDWPKKADGMWSDQLARLKTYQETGSGEPKGAAK